MDSLALGALVCTLPANIHPKPCQSVFLLVSTTYCNQGRPLYNGVVLLVPVPGDLLDQGLPLHHGVVLPVPVPGDLPLGDIAQLALSLAERRR